MFKTKHKKRNDGKYSETGITFKIHTNNDGVRATAIMLRSIAASSSWRSPVIAMKQASEITLSAFEYTTLISFPMRWVEGHISHSSRILRRCHPEQSTCSYKFGCRSFIKHTPLAVFFFYFSCIKTCGFFCKPQCGRILLKISLSYIVLRLKKKRLKI